MNKFINRLIKYIYIYIYIYIYTHTHTHTHEHMHKGHSKSSKPHWERRATHHNL